MNESNENAVSSLGNQGSQEFDSLISGNDPVAGQQQGTTPPATGENVAQTSDAGGTIPKKALKPDEGQAAPVTPPAAQPSPQQTQADIIRATAEAVAQAHMRGRTEAQPAAQPTQAELSPEEFTRKYNVTRANEDLIATILSADPKKASAALDQYGQNLVKQAILMTMELQDANLSKLRSDVDPHIKSWQSYQQERAAQAAEQRFFTSAPDLSQERDLVMELKDAFIAKVQAGQVRFENEQQAFQAVANAARTILKRVNPQWGQGTPAAGQPAPTTGQPARRMSVASSTGRSGTNAATAKSDVDLVFGADAR